jgi:hypothetical protein
MSTFLPTKNKTAKHDFTEQSIANTIYKTKEISPIIKSLIQISAEIDLDEDQKQIYYKIQNIEKMIHSYKNLIELSQQAKNRKQEQDSQTESLDDHQIHFIKKHLSRFLNFTCIESDLQLYCMGITYGKIFRLKIYLQINIFIANHLLKACTLEHLYKIKSLKKRMLSLELFCKTSLHFYFYLEEFLRSKNIKNYL